MHKILFSVLMRLQQRPASFPARSLTWTSFPVRKVTNQQFVCLFNDEFELGMNHMMVHNRFSVS